MPTRSINLLLALVVAFWSPAWCCCAASGTRAEATRIASPIAPAGQCPRCVKDEAPSPASSKAQPGDCPTCPMGAMRIWAKTDKSPQIASAPDVLFIVVPAAESTALPDAPLQIASHFSDRHAPPPGDSLVALHCMLTI